MTREEALALARLVAQHDGIALGTPDTIEVFQRSRPRRSGAIEWGVRSNIHATGPSAGFVIDDRTGAILSKQYFGFGTNTSSIGSLSHAPSRDFSVIERELFVRAPRSAVYDVFIDGASLAAISSPLLEPVTPLPNKLRAGELVDWRLRSGSREFSFSLRVAELRFAECIDEVQVQGPFRHFRHLLVFREAAAGTLLLERVEYRLPWGTLGDLVGEMLWGVTRAMEAALESRYAALSKRFGNPWADIG